MNAKRTKVVPAVLAVFPGLAGCDGADPGVDAPADLTAVQTVIPRDGATGVDPNEPLEVVFSWAVPAEVEHSVALHVGSVDGPEVAGTARWSPARTVLTFTTA